MNRTPGANSLGFSHPAGAAGERLGASRRTRRVFHNGDRNQQTRTAIRTTVRAAWFVQRGPSCNLPAGRPGAVESVSLLDVSPSLNCAGWVRSAGGFSVPSREDRLSDPAVMPRSGVAAPFVKMRVPVCNVPSLGKEKTTCLG